jgi:hypothetical protein
MDADSSGSFFSILGDTKQCPVHAGYGGWWQIGEGHTTRRRALTGFVPMNYVFTSKELCAWAQ